MTSGSSMLMEDDSQQGFSANRKSEGEFGDYKGFTPNKRGSQRSSIASQDENIDDIDII